jgi:C-terminal processing protease CtpA/Prc
MKKVFLLMFISFILISCGSVQKYNEQITALHSVEDLHTDVDKLYKQLKKHHPNLYQYTSKTDLDFKFDSLKQSIKQPATSPEFYKKLAPVVTNVRQGHVGVSSVSKRFTRKERKAINKSKLEFYDLDFEYLEGKLWIRNNYGKDSTLIGNEVVSINNEPAPKLVETYKTRFSSDGYNTTLYNRYVGKGFTAFYVRDKGFIDSLQVTFKSQDSTFTKLFKRIPKNKKKDSLTLDTTLIKKVKPKKLTKDQKKIKRITARKKKKNHKKYGYILKTKEYTRSLNFIGEDSTVAYMKIRGFSNGNYKKFYKESFAKLDSAKTKNFILDLRDNGGGRIAEIERLYSYLTDKEYQFITASEVNSRIPFMKYLMSNTSPVFLKVFAGIFSPVIITENLIKTEKKDGKLYYKFKESKMREPDELNYKGNMYVLINGNSFSASSLLSTHLKATKRATFVGEETGGAYNGTVAGVYKIYQLPTTKLKVRMGLMQVEAPQKQVPDGYGIKPDIEITPSVSDRKLKKDAELEWILDDITKTE